MSEYLANELILYLRKSRSDNPLESVEEVLKKHETIIQEFCQREFGFTIPEDNIYREVVSGESIQDRVEIKKVLSRIEDSKIKGILVIEPQRLSRGDLIDCGRLINTLQYTNTLVITPTVTYNMQNKMERRFFQDELMRGRDYLEYTKEILMRGKIASINRGCYIQSFAPYGYDKVKLGKDYTLSPNKDADTVRIIFDAFTNGKSTWEICRSLEKLMIKSPRGNDEWTCATIDKILRNKHYIGKVTYQRDKKIVSFVDGEKVNKRKRQKEGDYICVEGKHEAIIDPEVFEKAQQIISKRPPVHNDKILRNMFAGLLYCSSCGKIMCYKDKSGKSQYLTCKTPKCSKSIKYGIMVDVITETLEQSELPNLIARYNNGEGNAAEIQKKLLKSLEKELEDMRTQEETQYELLETKKYTQEIFDRRNKALREKMTATEERIKEVKRTMPDAIDYKEKIASMKNAIEAVKNPNVSEKDKNMFLKSIIERIDCTSNQTNTYGKFDISINVKLKI